MKRYKLTFTIVDTEEDARRICDRENSTGNTYKRRIYPAHYTPWGSGKFVNGVETETGFIVWYHY